MCSTTSGGGGAARPHLAGQPEQRLASRGPGRGVRHPDKTYPPAAERHVLAQPGSDIRPLGQELGRAQHVAGLVREITVDLVRDQGEPVRVGDLDRAAHLAGARHGAGRVVGKREHEHAGAGALPGRIGERLLERGRVGDAAGPAGGDRHTPDTLARERGLRGVADPGRLWQDDVAGEHRQKRPEERLAARRENYLVGVGWQPPAVEPCGRCRAGRHRARDRPVAVVGTAGAERVEDRLGNRQPGFTEGEVKDRTAGLDQPAQALVHGQRRGRRDDVGYRHIPTMARLVCSRCATTKPINTDDVCARPSFDGSA